MQCAVVIPSNDKKPLLAFVLLTHSDLPEHIVQNSGTETLQFNTCIYFHTHFTMNMSKKFESEKQRSDVPIYKMYIGGKWVTSSSGGTREAINPATGEVIGEVPDGDREDAQLAINAAADAQARWEQLSAFERATILEEIADAVEAETDRLSKWLTRDQGKPIDEARGEISLVIQMWNNAAAEIRHDETPSLESAQKSNYMFSIRKPHGILGVITPWNFPGTIPSEYLAPGIGVGNSVVWVPAPTTSVFSIKFVEVIGKTNIPDGVLNLVIGEGPVVGNEVVSNRGTDAVGFTGSPETGERIAKDAGAKPTLLELGGNGPVIVMDDADLSLAAHKTASGCFANAGQICSASERILVHEAVLEEFSDLVVEYAGQLELGDPTISATDMGPLNNEKVAAKMDAHIKNAVTGGANVLYGGERLADAPTELYYKPTVLSNVLPDSDVNQAETFGPIAPIISFADKEEAIKIANGIDLGLSSGVFTKDIDTMFYFADRLETGLVNFNEGSSYWEIHTPVGGYSGKKSGVGRIGGRFTIEELSQLKNIIIHTKI